METVTAHCSQVQFQIQMRTLAEFRLHDFPPESRLTSSREKPSCLMPSAKDAVTVTVIKLLRCETRIYREE